MSGPGLTQDSYMTTVKFAYKKIYKKKYFLILNFSRKGSRNDCTV